MSWPIFGVKSVYRMEARGRVQHRDRHYDPSSTLVEERVVLVRARTPHDAIRKADAEARKYVRGMSFRNAYGERVRQRYLKSCEAFELFDTPGVGAEVFSSTRLAPRRTSDEKVLREILGPRESRRDAIRRWRFVDDSLTREFMLSRRNT